MLSPNEARDLIAGVLFPQLRKERERLDKIDKWLRWNHELPHKPSHATREYRELAARAESGWGGLIVTSVAQTLFVDGYRRSEDTEDAEPWKFWQANGMDARQSAIFRAALAYGLSYVTVFLGKDPITGADVPVIRGNSPREFIAFYEDPTHDDLPKYGLRARPTRINKNTMGWQLTLIDDEATYAGTCEGNGEAFTAPQVVQEHGAGFAPIIRFANQLDLEGRSPGEIEPHVPLLGRIDQTTFDRLVVQRFASWAVRTVAGMSVAETIEKTGETAAQAKMRLKVEDILVAEDKDTKFGSLPASPLDGFIAAHDADIKDLAAVSQTPAHELLGSMANLSAEALAAARASQTAKSDERKTSFGESIELTLRVAASIAGDKEAASDVGPQVRWRDTSIRSLSQAADALGKLATMLGVPVELLWEKIPGWTQTDVERAKGIIENQGGMDKLAQMLLNGASPGSAAGA